MIIFAINKISLHLYNLIIIIIMKKLYPLLAAVILFIAAPKAGAQNGFSSLIQSSPGDATKLIDAYGQPLFKGFGADMNSGWANTAKTKKLLHFDLRITASGAFTPASDKTFDVTQIGLSNNVRLDPSSQSPIAQTITGDKNLSGPTLGVYNNTGQKEADFTVPSGKLPIIPAPDIQLTVGLVNNTDVTLRLIPNINVGNNVGSVSMLGFGLKHDIMQYFAGPAKKVVPFDLSVLFAWSRMNLNANLNVQPQDGEVHDPTDPNQSNDFSNQHTQAHFTSFLGEAIISKKLLFFTPFLAVGYNTASTNLDVIGNYPVTNSSADTYAVFTNPVTIHETSISGMRADIGFQLNLGIRIFASASLAEYKSVNAGIGFGF
jgi:hypothetical protein